MKWNAVLLATVICAALGCSQAPALRQAPVSVSGKVSKGGQPIGNVVVSFHPLDQGHLRSLPVNPDGTFAGELIAGNYAYYVGPSSAPTSQAALAQIDAKYCEPDLGRSVAVEPGKELLIALD
jgi:hypothetical protein